MLVVAALILVYALWSEVKTANEIIGALVLSVGILAFVAWRLIA
jgi:hypothetical protein